MKGSGMSYKVNMYYGNDEAESDYFIAIELPFIPSLGMVMIVACVELTITSVVWMDKGKFFECWCDGISINYQSGSPEWSALGWQTL